MNTIRVRVMRAMMSRAVVWLLLLAIASVLAGCDETEIVIRSSRDISAKVQMLDSLVHDTPTATPPAMQPNGEKGVALAVSAGGYSTTQLFPIDELWSVRSLADAQLLTMTGRVNMVLVKPQDEDAATLYFDPQLLPQAPVTPTGWTQFSAYLLPDAGGAVTTDTFYARGPLTPLTASRALSPACGSPESVFSNFECQVAMVGEDFVQSKQWLLTVQDEQGTSKRVLLLFEGGGGADCQSFTQYCSECTTSYCSAVCPVVKVFCQ